MYIPQHFEQPRIDIMQELIRARPLATLVTLSPGGIVANHVPLYLSQEEGDFGVLRGHIARNNPMWKEPIHGEALAIFHGPEAYISPSWYPSKKEHGRAVPTWNYTVVHASGPICFMEDLGWLLAHLETFTNQQEHALPDPWQVADAPHDFTKQLVECIVGVELVIEKITGKWKASQNQPEQNRRGVIDGLKQVGGAGAVDMANLMDGGSSE